MSRAIGKHLRTIHQQRQILDDWSAFEHEINEFMGSEPYVKVQAMLLASIKAGIRCSFSSGVTADKFLADYHYALDIAESRLKTIANRGGVVDITDTPLGHDVRCVSDPQKSNAPLGDHHRARGNLVRADFHDRFGRMPEANGYKLSIPHIPASKADAPIEELALAIQNPTYEQVVLACFADNADAMLYRLAVQ